VLKTPKLIPKQQRNLSNRGLKFVSNPVSNGEVSIGTKTMLRKKLSFFDLLGKKKVHFKPY
jgi:hypothetical protein